MTDTILPPQRRGDRFLYHFTLGNSWTGAMFTGGLKFTLRTAVPPSSTVTDTDAVDQASVDGGEITFADDTHGAITIPAARTTNWPARRLYWDLQGAVTIGSDVETLDSGSILIKGDITRSV